MMTNRPYVSQLLIANKLILYQGNLVWILFKGHGSNGEPPHRVHIVNSLCRMHLLREMLSRCSFLYWTTTESQRDKFKPARFLMKTWNYVCHRYLTCLSNSGGTFISGSWYTALYCSPNGMTSLWSPNSFCQGVIRQICRVLAKLHSAPLRLFQ